MIFQDLLDLYVLRKCVGLPVPERVGAAIGVKDRSDSSTGKGWLFLLGSVITGLASWGGFESHPPPELWERCVETYLDMIGDGRLSPREAKKVMDETLAVIEETSEAQAEGN